MAEPLCKGCVSRGRVVPATVADHIENVRAKKTLEEQWLAFKFGELQSLCSPCHQSKTDEETGRIKRSKRELCAFGIDGFPISLEEWREEHPKPPKHR
jgi:hypothetical protein